MKADELRSLQTPLRNPPQIGFSTQRIRTSR
jgi:hypothetical protein